jgi:Zn-dependent protease
LDTQFLQGVALFFPMLLFSVIAHEIAHGYAALKQGDPTAYNLGRLSWNPIKHIDPFLTILLPLMTYWSLQGAMLGGAKPVPVNPRNYKNFKRGDIIVSLAGVATNLIIAVGCVIVIAILGLIARAAPPTLEFAEIAQAIFIRGIAINWMLIIFNLLPIPPLDGSHVIKYLLPPAWSMWYADFGARFGFLILLTVFVFARGLLSTLLMPAFYLADVFLSVVDPLVLNGTWQWFQR